MIALLVGVALGLPLGASTATAAWLLLERRSRLNPPQLTTTDLTPSPASPDLDRSLDDLRHYLWQWHDRHAQSLDALGDRLDALAPGPEAIASVATLPATRLDYGPLRDLLAEYRWRAADELTRAHLLALSGRGEEDYLRWEDWEQLPSEELVAIAQVWHSGSEGRFGWWAQRDIWQGCGGDYGDFCDRVGWRKGEAWCYYDELRFSGDAPLGHLPASGWKTRSCYGVGSLPAAETLALVLARLGEGVA